MLPALVHFLNHGTLPFVGRAEELRQIREFWRMTSESHGLRSMLMIGEAGVGKSRLVEESIAAIRGMGGTVIHAKLYPDSANAIAPLLARAIARSPDVQPLLKGEPEETVSGVGSAMVRICSLRPTLIVIEDIHLVNGEALEQLARVLDWLCDEPLSLLLTARPVEIAARSMLERYIVDVIMLAGLQQRDIGALCREVFGERVEKSIVGVLEQKTGGNALALRSALRGAISSGALVSDVNTTGRVTSPVVKIDQGAFATALERNVRLLSEGMVAHLNEQEKKAAGQLAALGEVMARESALVLLTTAGSSAEESARLLDQLTFKGIITTSSIRPLLIGDAQVTGPSLSFTHSLLHRHLLASSSPDPALIVRILAARVPIYSVVPYELVGNGAVDLPWEVIDTAIRRAVATTYLLDQSTDWQLIRVTYRAAASLFEAARDRFPEEIRVFLEASIVNKEMVLHRRSSNYEQRRDIAARLLEICSAPYESLLSFRLNGLKWISWAESHIDPEACERHRAEMRALVEEHPHLKLEWTYLNALRERAVNEIGHGLDGLRAIERELDEILAMKDAPEATKNYALGIVGPYLLECCETEEELHRREALLAELERLDATAPSDQHLYFVHNSMFFLVAVGRYDEALERIEEGMPLYSSYGYWMYELHGRMLQRFIDIMRGGDISGLPAWAEELRLSLVEPNDLWTATDIVNGLVRPLVMRGEPALATDVINGVRHITGNLDPAEMLLVSLGVDDFSHIDRRIDDADVSPLLRALHRALRAGDEDAPELDVTLLRAALERPMIRDESILFARAVAESIDRLDSRYRHVQEDLAGATADLVERMLVWFADRALPFPMAPILARHGARLGGRLAHWQSRYEALMKEQRSGESRGAGRIHITMFGAIGIQRPGEEPERVRGAQLCALLGLLVADRLQESPLSQREFLALAMGADRDPESARKSFNFAVFRLRELLGNPLAIDTSGDTPRLSTDLVEVDFLDAAEALERAREALSVGALMRAIPDLMTALRISAGEVVYPTLYQDFFEGGRGDFESALRNVTIGVSKGLIREQDFGMAEDILTRAFEAMSDDGELGELLQQVLVRQGKRARAARISIAGEVG